MRHMRLPVRLLLFAWPLILLVCDLLHPVDDLAVQFLLDSDVRHRGPRQGAVPVLLSRRAPDNVARTDHLDRATPTLHAATTGRDDQRLAERMGVPVATGARLERHVGAACPRGAWRLEELVYAHGAGEILGRPSSGGLGPVSLELHVRVSFLRSQQSFNGAALIHRTVAFRDLLERK